MSATITRKGQAGQPGNKGQFAAKSHSEAATSLTATPMHPSAAQAVLPLSLAGWSVKEPFPDQLAVVEAPDGSAEYYVSRDPGSASYVIAMRAQDERIEGSIARPVYAGRIATTARDLVDAAATHNGLVFDSVADRDGFLRNGKARHTDTVAEFVKQIHRNQCEAAMSPFSGKRTLTPAQLCTVEDLNEEMGEKAIVTSFGVHGLTDLSYSGEGGTTLRLTINDDGTLHSIGEGTTLHAVATDDDANPAWERFSHLIP